MVLICYDGLKDTIKKDQDALYLDLRMGLSKEVELMEVYESIEPELIEKLRTEIKTVNPSTIVVVGESDNYKWLGTVVTRTFGQFSSWINQYDKDFGITNLKINENDVTLYAVKNLEDWGKLQ